MKIILVHGILTDGSNNIDILGDELQRRGYIVEDVQLPRRNPITARFCAEKDAELVLAISNPGDVIISHSNGGNIAGFAQRYCEYSHAFYIAPAMSKNWQFYNPSRVWCFYSPRDLAVWIGALLIMSPFGKAGVQGFRQLKPYHQNIKFDSNHNDYFDKLLMIVADRIEWTVKCNTSLAS